MLSQFGDNPIVTGSSRDNLLQTALKISEVAVPVNAIMGISLGIILCNSPICENATRKSSPLTIQKVIYVHN